MKNKLITFALFTGIVTAVVCAAIVSRADDHPLNKEGPVTVVQDHQVTMLPTLETVVPIVQLVQVSYYAVVSAVQDTRAGHRNLPVGPRKGAVFGVDRPPNLS